MFLLTKIQEVFCLPLMPRQAVTFAKTNNRKFFTCRSGRDWPNLFEATKRLKKLPAVRRQNLSAQASAQPQLSRSKQPQTRRRSNSEAVLPRCARPLGIRRRLYGRLVVKVPTPVLHRCAENKMQNSTGRIL